jgi:hypothetical protein
MKSLSLATIVGLATLSSSLVAVEATPVSLDTLIIYSQGAETAYEGDVETRINYLVESTNKIYADSGLNVKLNPVKIQKYTMDDSTDSGTVLSAIREDEEIQRIRNEVGADNVVIYRPYAGDGMCGLAYQNNYLNDPEATWVEQYAYAHVSIDCGGYVTAHEVGHNTGLGHSAAQDSTGAYTYARGHGVQNNFTTVMAYEASYNGPKINKYSSPALDCNGLPCGIEEGEENEADAVKALLQTLPLVENFREHIVIDDGNTTDDNNTENKITDPIDNGEDDNATDDNNEDDNVTDGGDDGDEDNTTDDGNNDDSDNNTTIDDGDDDNNNGTVDDDAQRLADALKAYNDQLAKVDADKVELTKLKAVIQEKKDAITATRETYKEKRALYTDIKKEYRALIKAYRTVKTEYRKAERDFKRNRITQDELDAVKTKLDTAKTTYETYYNDVVLPASTELKEFKATTIQPAIDAYKEAVSDYRTFYKDVYRVDVTTLRTLKKEYLTLKREIG